MMVRVKAFASDVVHMAEVPENHLIAMTHVGALFTAIPLPAVMMCGAVLRKRYGYTVAIKMAEAEKVTCTRCKHRAGLPW